MAKNLKHRIAYSVNFLVILGSLSVKIYLPALPDLKQFFATTDQLLALSVSLFLLGYGVSGFFWGSLASLAFYITALALAALLLFLAMTQRNHIAQAR